MQRHVVALVDHRGEQVAGADRGVRIAGGADRAGEHLPGSGGETRQAAFQIVVVQVGHGDLPYRSDPSDRLLERALADGGNRDAGGLDRLRQVIWQIDVDLRHPGAPLGPIRSPSKLTPLGVRVYNPIIGHGTVPNDVADRAAESSYPLDADDLEVRCSTPC